MAITEEQVKALNQERIDASNKAKAEAFAARKSADGARGWYWFLRNHTGQRGLANGVYVDCEANKQLLLKWLEDSQLSVDHQSLEQAYQANKERLAQLRAEAYQRVTDTQQSRVFPQLKSLETKEPPAYAPWTKAEILSWDAARLHKELAKGSKHVNKINQILAGQN